MKIKKLVWKDIASAHSKEQGDISLQALTPIDKFYDIFNHYDEDNPEQLFLETEFQEEYVEISSIEEGKELAQQHYEKLVTKLFLEDDTTGI